MTTEADIQESIANAWEAADTSIDAAVRYSDQAVTASQGSVRSGRIHEIEEPDTPKIIIPDDDLAGTYSKEYNAALYQIEAMLDNRLSEFLDTYYPDYAKRLETVSDWLDNAIKNGGTGLPIAIEAAIWDRDRSRHDAQALRGEHEVISTWANRGFPLPPGVTARQVRRVQQENVDNLQQRSREIAIEQAKLELENIRFAIQQSTALNATIASTATNYMNAIISVASHAGAKAAALRIAWSNTHADSPHPAHWAPFTLIGAP